MSTRFPFHATLARTLIAIACVTIPACAASGDRTDPAAGSTDDSSDATSASAVTINAQCGLVYENTACAGGPCPSTTLAVVNVQTTGSYPAAGGTLTADGAPYTGYTAGNAAATLTNGRSLTDGYFDLVIVQANAAPNTEPLVSSEAEVSTANITRQVDIEAGDLRASVPPFTYNGVSYNFLEIYCSLTGAKAGSH